MTYEQLTQKKKILDALRPLPKALAQNLSEWFRVELTYTSNAIEGNTLTRQETALVLEKGITIGRKSLVEHLEAVNHAKVWDAVMSQMMGVRRKHPISERDILDVHSQLLEGIDDANAGHYRTVAVRVAGSRVVFPNPRKVPDLMTAFVRWLHTAKPKPNHPVALAAEAHLRLVTIHPFVDGNGRTARLLMNMLLQQHGYPPVVIRMRDRLRYLKALEAAQLGGSEELFWEMIRRAAGRSLDMVIEMAQASHPSSS